MSHLNREAGIQTVATAINDFDSFGYADFEGIITKSSYFLACSFLLSLAEESNETYSLPEDVVEGVIEKIKHIKQEAGVEVDVHQSTEEELEHYPVYIAHGKADYITIITDINGEETVEIFTIGPYSNGIIKAYPLDEDDE